MSTRPLSAKYKTLLFVGAVLSLLLLPDTMQCGILPFNCRVYKVYEIGTADEIALCTDTLTLHVGIPIPAKHPDSPVETPVEIYQVVNESDSVRLDPIPLTIHNVEDEGNIIVRTNGMPWNGPDSINQTRYLLRTHCTYFNGATNEPPIDRYFVKRNLINAYSIARSMVDSSELNVEGITPTREKSLTAIGKGVNLFTIPKHGSWNFHHWSSSLNVTDLQPAKRKQVVREGCWPQYDTVVFTAWYTDQLVSVESVGSVHEFEKEKIHYDPLLAQLTVQSEMANSCIAQLIDLQGRTIREYRSRMQSEVHAIDAYGLHGLHFLVGTMGMHPFTFPVFFHY